MLNNQAAKLALAAVAALLATACGTDAPCGPALAPGAGVSADITSSAGPASVTFANFTSSPNNDCTPAEGGATSITVDGTQTGQDNFHITFCLPRPTELGGDPVLVTDTQRLEVIDINARLDADCLLVLDRTSAGTGSVTFVGYCGDGLDPGGYGMTFNAVIPGTRICTGGDAGTQQESVSITLGGSVAVDAL